MKIAPSVLAAPLTRIGESIAALDENVTDYLHLDVMDGHFVPQISFGEAICQSISEQTKIPLDVHLMVSDPGVEVPKYYQMKPAFITFHHETTNFPIRLAREIRKQGIGAGLAVNPVTPISSLEALFPYFDLFLIMSIEPGFYGQSFLEISFERMEQFHRMKDRLSARYSHAPLLEVDGGVNAENISQLKKAGVDIAVAGSFVFKAEDPNEKILLLKKNADV